MRARGFCLVLAVLTLVRHAALLGRLDTAIPSDPGDPLLNTWIVWWNAHHIPFTTAYWNAPAFAPAPYALALSETLLGLTWLTTPAQWLGASPLVAYNVAFMTMPVLNGVSAYWLCVTLTNRRDAATIGGLAYAFAPFHASQLPHIQAEAMFWMPAALVGLHRYWSTGKRRWLALLGAAFALNGLTSGYFFLFFSVFLAMAIAWLTMAFGTRRRVLGVLTALAMAVVALAPVIGTYRSVRHAWNLAGSRSMVEIESFSADVLNVFTGSDRLLLWPIHGLGLYPVYPGVVILLLVLVAFVVSPRASHTEVPASRWRRRVITVLMSIAAAALAAGGVYGLIGPWAVTLGPLHLTVSEVYKPVGFGMNLLLVAAVLTRRFAALVTSGSMTGLYATGAIAAAILALGPVVRVYGQPAWYKPPYSWLMPLPGFDSSRIPALFFAITVLCLAVLAAYAVTRLMPDITRKSLTIAGAIAVAIVLDGWVQVPVVDVPRPLPVAANGDLVMEVPRRSVFDDTAAMYRGITHGRPVVNGYSGYHPPHYGYLIYDLDAGCVDSLDAVRGGRSLDVVIWRGTEQWPAMDAALQRHWGSSIREATNDVVVYRVPRAPAFRGDPVDASIDLQPFCLSTRPR